MQNKSCVYVHINKTNGKIYIGKTQNVKKRWHPEGYKGCPYFYKAILKYGWDGFDHIVLIDNLSEEEATIVESELIKKYKTTNQKIGYNIELGQRDNKFRDSVKNRNKKKKPDTTEIKRKDIIFSNGISKLNNVLSNPEISTMFLLSDYVCSNDCVLRNHGARNGKIMDIELLAHDLSIPKGTLKRNVNSLIKKGVLLHTSIKTVDSSIQQDCMCYIMNPYICHKDNDVYHKIYKLFNDPLQNNDEEELQ